MLNDRIKELRNAYGLTQVELAKQLGVTKQCISNWENDNILPSVDMLIKLAKYFSVSTDYLLCIESNRWIDISKLTDAQAAHISMIIDDILGQR